MKRKFIIFTTLLVIYVAWSGYAYARDIGGQAPFPPKVTQSIAEAGTSTTIYSWTPEAVKWAIQVLSGTATGWTSDGSTASTTKNLDIGAVGSTVDVQFNNMDKQFHVFTTGATYSGTYNPVFKWGYNLIGPDTAVDPTEPRFHVFMEGNYNDVGVTGHHLMEWGLDYTSADGLHNGRPYSFYIDRDNWNVVHFFTGDHITLKNEAGTSEYAHFYMNGNTTIARLQTSNTDASFQNLGSGGALILNNTDDTVGNFEVTDYMNANGVVVARAGARNVSHDDSKGAYAILTRNGASFGYRIYVDEDGNVGINTNSPDGRFCQGGSYGSQFCHQSYSASADITATATVTVQVNIPTGVRILSSACQVSSPLAEGDLWDLELNNGAQVLSLATGLAVALNTADYDLISNVVTNAETDLVVTKSGGGAFTVTEPPGAIECIVHGEYQTSLTAHE